MNDPAGGPAPVRIEREGEIAVIVVDNPPVNAGSTAVRRGLLEAVRAVAASEEFVAAVILGAGKTFIAGADIKEFDLPPQEPQMPALVAAIEACPKPVVAAIHGASLGGGFEIALGCDARIATADAVVGLPEVRLGLIPGAGGTQRLPRLAGVARAIDIIASGRHVPVREAAEIGLIDHVVASGLRDEAVALARTLTAKRRVSEMGVPRESPDAIAKAAAAAQPARAAAAVGAAVATIRMAESLPFGEALAQERAIFLRLRQSAESAALRYQFVAERRALRSPAGAGVRTIERVGVIGLGLMGSGIAASLAAAGFEVLVAEQDGDALRDGAERAGNVLKSIARRGRWEESALTAAVARIRPVDDLAGMAAIDLAIEAVIEDMSAKERLFRRLDGILPANAVLASNTSYLDVEALARATRRPASVAGLHFFSPAHVMRLVEVVRAAATAPEVVAALHGLARRLGKIPIVARAGEGFIGNRILSAYRGQCDLLLEEGAYPEDVDAALTEFGLAMGPYAVSDLAGLDIAWRMRQRKAATRDPRARYFPAADRLCENGRLGRKAGAGWYRYADGDRTGSPDPEVRALINQLAAESGTSRRAIGAGEIRDRAIGAMVNEACHVLDEGVAERPSDVDLVMVHGYGFPAGKGGPLFWAARQDRTELLAMIDRMVAASGFGAKRAKNVDEVLDQFGA